MNYEVIKKENLVYIVFDSNEEQLKREEEATDFISKCWENDTNYLVFYDKALSDDFFNLKTRLAGMVLQKFMNYKIKVGVIIEDEDRLNDRFREMILESNKGNDFRTFKDITEAENWLLKLK